MTEVWSPTPASSVVRFNYCSASLFLLTRHYFHLTFINAVLSPISASKIDERSCFLYVHYNSDDFQLCFPSQLHCKG